MNDEKSTPLREKMKADLMLRNYSKHSEELYLHHVQRFAEHYHKSPELLGLDEIRSYLLFLREKANVSQSSYKQTVAALRFLYKYTLGKEWLKEKIPYPKLRKRLPVVLTQEEVVAHIQAGKGAQERIAMLSPKLLQTLREAGINKKASVHTLLQVGRNNLKCELGFFSLLHSWGQTLTLHPHLHVVIPGCGIKGDKVTHFKKRYFVPDRILSAVFRGKFVSLLKKARRAGKLRGDFDDFEAFIDRTVKSKWVVRTKPPFAGPEVVLAIVRAVRTPAFSLKPATKPHRRCFRECKSGILVLIGEIPCVLTLAHDPPAQLMPLS